MTAYTNYQLPASHYNSNSYSQPTTQDPFASEDPFAATPTRLASSTPASASPSSNSSAFNMAEIIASQERAMEQAKSRNSPSRAITTTTNTHPSSNRSMVVAPNSQNPTGSDAVHPLKKQMKRQRHAKMAAGGVGGALVGTLVLGPVGTFLGAPIGCYTANKISKKGERRAQRKFEQHSVREQAMNSPSMQSGAFC
jgi:hypothetical protein